MRVATTIFLTLFAPTVLAAQQVQGGAAGSATVDGGVTRPTASADATGEATADARIEAAIARAEAHGLGTTGLVSRVQMGEARNVARARVAAALEHRVEAMLRARDALRTSGDADSRMLVELGADAIEGGARVAHVAQVASSFDGEARTRALATLGSLAAEGRIGADVVASVQSALNAGSAAATGASAGATAAGGGTAATRATGGVAGTAASAGANVSAAIGGTLPR